MVLDQSQQHGHHHLLLSFKLSSCVRFIGSSQYEKVMDDGLQSRYGCGDKGRAKKSLLSPHTGDTAPGTCKALQEIQETLLHTWFMVRVIEGWKLSVHHHGRPTMFL